ncbi:hypothetical protein BDFB_012539 [Asbolus verrucosus]|uniref:Uncharacterized protein n=1 Tax=Asbolus verrucosus TaxID=1661398 RepID=A0A482VUN7_ASBVE|nr:hypothetical protein BDFB_012539 [Asbolus verrucosus]
MGPSGSNVKPFRFLENYSFVPFYGLTATEIRQLKEIQQIISGVKIYNTWSVLEYASKAKEDEVTYEWQDTGYIVGLQEAFRFPVIMKIIQTKLLLNDPIEIKKFKCFRIEDVLETLILKMSIIQILSSSFYLFSSKAICHL